MGEMRSSLFAIRILYFDGQALDRVLGVMLRQRAIGRKTVILYKDVVHFWLGLFDLLRFFRLLHHLITSGYCFGSCCRNRGNKITYIPLACVSPNKRRSPLDNIFRIYTFYIADGVEAFAALVITLAALQTTWSSLRLFFARPPQPEERKVEIRLQLGRWLSLALEFELAADILRTAIAPTWDEIGKLAAIVVLRTLLNYFLEREISSAGLKEK